MILPYNCFFKYPRTLLPLFPSIVFIWPNSKPDWNQLFAYSTLEAKHCQTVSFKKAVCFTFLNLWSQRSNCQSTLPNNHSISSSKIAFFISRYDCCSFSSLKLPKCPSQPSPLQSYFFGETETIRSKLHHLPKIKCTSLTTNLSILSSLLLVKKMKCSCLCQRLSSPLLLCISYPFTF